jgi:hypothetical protein
MQCLSVLQCTGTLTKPICDVCREHHDNYARRAIREAISAATRLLIAHGYTVIPPS